MWARVVEFMLACWLATSPFVFQHPDDAVLLWINDFTSAALVTSFALLSYWRPTRHIHLLTAVVSLWLIGFGRFGTVGPPSPAMQNEILTGLLLLMFSIVPNYAARPPVVWYGDQVRELR